MFFIAVFIADFFSEKGLRMMPRAHCSRQQVLQLSEVVQRVVQSQAGIPALGLAGMVRGMDQKI